MASPYTTVAVTGYNDNPPVDDGTASEENRVLWETIKEKLPDPLKTAIEAVNTNVLAAFLKVIGGAGVTSSAVGATIGASDQGKLYRATGGGITIVTPDATSVTSPWVCGFLNSGTAANILDGNGTQTINGVASLTIPVGGGGILFTDGTNWFLVGLGGVPTGKELMHGEIINGTISESNATNAATYALKTLAGADPSTDDPVLICFRNATAATGNYVYRTVTGALSLVIPSTATMGAANAVPFDIAVALFDDAGTIRLGAINPFQSSDFSFYPLAQIPPIATSTTIGTGSDAAKTWYTGTGVTSKPYLIAAIARYASGLVTAGSWNVSPTTLQPFGHGIPLPGEERAQLLHVREEQAANTSGGTFTSGAWRTRTLNTTLVNEISGASLGSNQITLPAGTYEIDALAPGLSVGVHKAKLRNTTDSTDTLIGLSMQNDASTGLHCTNAPVRGRFTIAAQKVFELQHQCGVTRSTNGLGLASNLGVVEVYSDVVIRKIG